VGRRAIRQADDLVERSDGLGPFPVPAHEIAQTVQRALRVRILAREPAEKPQARHRGVGVDAAAGQLLLDPFDADLIELVERDEGVAMQPLGNAGAVEKRRERAAIVQPDDEVLEAKAREDLAHRSEHLGFHHRRSGSDRIDVALVELAESSLRGPVCAPDRLDLIPLEEFRQLVLILRDDARQRHREVVP
jgi:hypothetical protein